MIEIALQGTYRFANGDFLYRRIGLPIYTPDPIRVYRVQSNLNWTHSTNEYSVTYYTDNLGLRSAAPDKATRLEKADGVYRILVLGPSFAFGYANNYADMFVTKIREQLSATDREIEIFNLGTPAQLMAYQLCWLKEMGREVRPDLLIQTVYGPPLLSVTNCRLPQPLPLVARNGYLVTSQASLMGRLGGRARQSAVAFYSWYLYQSVFATDPMPMGQGGNSAGDQSFEKYRMEEAVNVYRNYLDFVKAAVSDPVEVAFLYIPYSFVIRPEDTFR